MGGVTTSGLVNAQPVNITRQSPIINTAKVVPASNANLSAIHNHLQQQQEGGGKIAVSNGLTRKASPSLIVPNAKRATPSPNSPLPPRSLMSSAASSGNRGSPSVMMTSESSVMNESHAMMNSASPISFVSTTPTPSSSNNNNPQVRLIYIKVCILYMLAVISWRTFVEI
jgi:hypothetical protein